VLLDFRAFPGREQRTKGCGGSGVLYLVVPHLPSSGIYTPALSGEHPLDGFPQILEYVPAISHLYSLGCSRAGRLGVLWGAGAADNFDTRLGLEPVVERLDSPIWQQFNRGMALEIDQDGSIAMRLAFGPIVDP
jgi:hypothetical protein